LATRLTIRENGTDVARCHISYRDASRDPSMGPTIEMMAVHQDYRDKNLLPVLWYWGEMLYRRKLYAGMHEQRDQSEQRHGQGDVSHQCGD
jgi:hypothetical protein